MKKLLHSFLLVFTLTVFGALLPAQEAIGSHYVGSDITFAYTGTPGYYLLRLTFYRDCGGVPQSNASNVIHYTNSCGVQNTFTLNNSDLNNVFDVSDVCASAQTECNSNSSFQGVELYEYNQLIFLGSCSGDWNFWFGECCRNEGITNFSGNSGGYEWFTTAYLNTGPQSIGNNSPIFSSTPVPYVCIGDTVRLNPQVTDPDGDSLAFSLVPARDEGININYAIGYDSLHPFGTNTYNYLNPVTGQFDFVPTSTGAFVVVIKVEEWRMVGGVMTLVGIVHRDVQVQVYQCNSDAPVLNNLTLSGGGQPDFSFPPNSIQEVQACVPYCITIPAYSTEPGVTLTMTSNAANEVPNSTFTVDYTTNGDTTFATGTLCFQADTALAGRIFSFTVAVTDDVCPVPNDFVRAFSLQVTKTTGFRVTASEDTICANTSVQLNAIERPNTDSLNSASYTGFNWRAENLQGQAVDGYFQGSNSIINPVVSPKRTTRYILRANTIFSCTDADTVVVVVKGLQPDIQSVTAGDSILCVGQSTVLTPIFQGPTGVLQPDTITWNYHWTPAGFSDSTIRTPVVSYSGEDTMMYTVVISNGMCSDTGSVQVVYTPGADVTPALAPSTICIGDTVQLSAIVSGTGAAGSTFSWTGGARIDDPDSTNTFALPVRVGVSYYTYEVTTELGCVISDSISVSALGVFPNMQSFNSPLTFCEDQTTSIPVVTNPDTAAINASPFQYLWTPPTGLSNPNIQSPTISYDGDNSVTYTVYVDGGNGCAQSDTVTINFVESIAVAPTASDYEVCVGDRVELMGNFNPSGVVGTITWTGSGVNADNNENTFAIPETPGTQTYNVEIILSQNCHFDGSLNINVQGYRPDITNITANSPLCYADSAQVAVTVENTPGANFVYNWTANNTTGEISDSTSSQTWVNPETTTIYSVNVSDNGTCSVDSTIEVVVGADIDLSYSVTYSPDSLSEVPVTVTFTNNSTTTGPIDSVYWILQNVNDPSAPELILNGGTGGTATHVFTENSQWNVTMYVITPGPDGGCIYTLQKPLWIGAFVVPNVITPNGDGLNDVFMITNLKPNTTVTIFNRWGKKVGEFGQGGSWAPNAELPGGVYFYSIDEKNTGRKYKGWLEILR